MKKAKLILITVFIFCFSFIKAQNIAINNEVGIFLGPTFMQTDYGEAHNFDSSINNTGFGFGFAYIADFSDSRVSSKLGRLLTEHVKLRADFSYVKVNFAYDGQPVEALTLESQKFRAMTGGTKLLNFGIYSEIYIKNLVNDNKFQPYILTGVSYVSAKPSIKTSMELPNIYLPEEENIFLDKQTFLSLGAGVGARYNLDNIDFVVEYRFNAFLSDRIEGLEAHFSGNKNNDAQTSINLGVVFSLE